ncbi:hypothetical protein SDC9_146228 [bioreactor metagenome]|uniref:Uncharacterized protein n=1 Tax=bioreactor metagenome TaxID=1076179 RepID=A0A645ED64_9ZZZZ
MIPIHCDLKIRNSHDQLQIRIEYPKRVLNNLNRCKDTPIDLVDFLPLPIQPCFLLFGSYIILGKEVLLWRRYDDMRFKKFSNQTYEIPEKDQSFYR